MKPKVLIIDDEPAIRRLYAGYCRSLGYEVQEAANGTIALDRIDKGLDDLDAVIVDMYLGDMNGMSLIHHIRERNQDLSVVVSTGMPSFSLMQEAILTGIDGFIIKPVNYELFHTTLTRAVRNARNARYSRNKMLELQKLLEIALLDYNKNYTGIIEALVEGIF